MTVTLDAVTGTADGQTHTAAVVRDVDPWAEFISSMPGPESAADVAALRDEWDR